MFSVSLKFRPYKQKWISGRVVPIAITDGEKEKKITSYHLIAAYDVTGTGLNV